MKNIVTSTLKITEGKVPHACFQESRLFDCEYILQDNGSLINPNSTIPIIQTNRHARQHHWLLAGLYVFIPCVRKIYHVVDGKWPITMSHASLQWKHHWIVYLHPGACELSLHCSLDWMKHLTTLKIILYIHRFYTFHKWQMSLNTTLNFVQYVLFSNATQTRFHYR